MYIRYLSLIFFLSVIPIFAMENQESKTDIWQAKTWDKTESREINLRQITQDLEAMKEAILRQSTTTNIEFITLNQESAQKCLNMLATINTQENKYAIYKAIDEFIYYYIDCESSYKKIGKQIIEKYQRTP